MRDLFERKFREPKGNAPIALVACSGGVDSMVLLDLLRGYGADVMVCHIDHGQRDKKARALDAQVIQTYCRAHGIPVLLLKPAGLEPGASESRLRQARYKALSAAAHGLSRPAIVFTAHHADDDLETLLFRLIRGAHPDSLKGIPARAKRTVGGRQLRLARPLLRFSKEQLVDYARSHGVEWHEDATNRSSRYARNRIRNELIPLLEALRQGSVRRIQRFFNELVEQKAPSPSKARVHELRKSLLGKDGYSVSSLDFSTLKAAIDLILDEQSSRTTQAHWETLRRQLDARHATRNGGGPRKLVQFPGGHAVCFEGNRVFWVRN